MALRDKLKARSEKLLEPGEQVQQVFLAQSGMNPNLAFVSSLLIVLNKYWVVAVTDRGVVVLSAPRLRPSFPKSVAMRLPRQTNLGPTSGALWSVINVPGAPKPVYVHRRFYKDVAAADAGAGASFGSAAGWGGGVPQAAAPEEMGVGGAAEAPAMPAPEAPLPPAPEEEMPGGAG